ncbi:MULTISPECIES: hypothetical protein [unclassified Blastococcus]
MREPGRGATRRGTGLAALGVAIALGGCGNDPPTDPVPAAPASPSAADPTGMPAGSAVPDALPGSPPEVEAALLTTDDLGAGWTDLGPVPLEERGSPGCPQAGVISAGEDPARLGEAQSYYAEDDPDVVTFGESVSVWASADVARERLATFASQARECRSFEQQVLDGSTVTVRTEERDVPPLGDEAVALVQSFELSPELTVLRDVVVVRIGDALVLVDGPDVAEGDETADSQRQQFDELAAQAVEKAARALSS